MLVMLVLATHVTAARAAGNTITQTAITSPSDPSYFYDPTGGAQNSNGQSYGGITVTGTTNSTDPANDTVDIACYFDNGTTFEDDAPLVTGVPLNSSGGFSTTVPYYAIENDGIANSSVFNTGECRLRAVPAGTTPQSDSLSSFAGPRVLLASLKLNYSPGNYGPSQPSGLDDYSLSAPQLGAVDNYTAALDPNGNPYCGLTMSLASTYDFGDASYPSFNCADSFWSWDSQSGGIEVDGQPVYDTFFGSGTYLSDPIAVSVTHNSTNGDITIHETEPLDQCSSGNCVTPSGVTDDRTIQQTGEGRVVLITDDFVSTDGKSHQVDFSVSSNFDQSAEEIGGTDLFELPGQSSYTPYNSGDTADLGSGLPGTIYSYNNPYSDGSHAGYDALTYFTAPSGSVSFAYDQWYNPVQVSTAVIPFTLNVPAGGSQSLSIAYASEYSPAALAGDLQIERDLQTAPVITIGSPAAGATVSDSTVTVTGSVSAFTGVKTVSVDGLDATVSNGSFSATVPLTSGSNTITAVVTTNTGITASATESVTYTPSSAGTPITPPVTPPAVTPPAATPVTPPAVTPPAVTPPAVTPPAVAPITPAVTGSASATWLPIANTGVARHLSGRRERLHGSVTSGSGAVTYYFQYGSHGHLNHRSKPVALTAGKSSRHVALTIGGLSDGTKYTYRLVATGTYGNATGSSRTFKTTARHK